jgi:glycosyltransferase involved in cell wall biosynthesis
MNPNAAPLKLMILLPIYNDWECLPILLERLGECLKQQAALIRVLVVDDCSEETSRTSLLDRKLHHIARVDCLRMKRNMGHQRAIAIGLTYIHKECECDAVLVMDADGEDKPEDAVRLVEQLQKTRGQKVIFAERTRRSESMLFRICYLGYRVLHRLLTGIPVRFGNFSIVPARHLTTLAVVSEAWNHYAASILKARIPFSCLPTDRGTRYCGQSKFNFASLVAHGISAIAVFAELVGVRVILSTLALVLTAFALLLVVVGIRLFTELAIPGWATNAVGFLFVIVLQMLTVAVSLTLGIFFTRNTLNFLPSRDFAYFVGEKRTLYERRPGPA